MLVVFNDNDMSISENVGALTNILGPRDGQPPSQRVARTGQEAIPKQSFFGSFAKRWEEHAKGMFVPSTLFEELGFHYTGPIDGHDMPR